MHAFLLLECVEGRLFVPYQRLRVLKQPPQAFCKDKYRSAGLVELSTLLVGYSWSISFRRETTFYTATILFYLHNRKQRAFDSIPVDYTTRTRFRTSVKSSVSLPNLACIPHYSQQSSESHQAIHPPRLVRKLLTVKPPHRLQKYTKVIHSNQPTTSRRTMLGAFLTTLLLP